MPGDRDRIPLEQLLPLVGAAVARHRRRLLAGHPVTPTGVAVLAALDDGPQGPPSLRELAGRVGLSPGTLTPVIDALEGVGAVHRLRDRRDRRVVRLHRTPAGRARLAAARPRSPLPQPDPELEPAVRAYLLAVLDAAEEWA